MTEQRAIGEDAARRLLRRLGLCFLVVVLTLPLVALGGAWSFVLLLDLVMAVFALQAALRLRSVRDSV